MQLSEENFENTFEISDDRMQATPYENGFLYAGTKCTYAMHRK